MHFSTANLTPEEIFRVVRDRSTRKQVKRKLSRSATEDFSFNMSKLLTVNVVEEEEEISSSIDKC